MVFFTVKSDTFFIYKICMKAVGVWPLERNRGSTIIFWTTMCLQIASLILRFIDPLGQCRAYELGSNNFATTSFLISGVVLKLCLRISGSRIIPLIRSTIEDWSSITDAEEREVMIRHDKFGVFVTAFEASLLIAVLAKALKERSLLINREKSPISHRGLCAFNEDSPWITIIITVEMILMFNLALTFWSTSCLGWSLAMHLSSQYKILQMRLQNLLLIDSENESRKAFRQHIQRHNELLVLTKDQENAFNLMITTNILIDQLYLCISAALLTPTIRGLDFIGGATHLLSIMCTLVGIYMIYFACDYLTSCCDEVGEAFIQCNWYDLCKEFRINYTIVIMKCRMPVKFTVLKIYKLNLSNFKYVLEALYSYISLIIAITKDEK